MNHAAAITDIESLCRRYNHAGCEPGTHALAYKIIGIMQRHGVIPTENEVTELNGVLQNESDNRQADRGGGTGGNQHPKTIPPG